MGIIMKYKRDCSVENDLLQYVLCVKWELLVCLVQVKIQKESEVRLKIIGTRVDATEIVSWLPFILWKFLNWKCSSPLEF